MWARDLSRVFQWWAGRESNPHSRMTADLQSAELTTCSTYPRTTGDAPRTAVHGGLVAQDLQWSRRWDSNPEPAVYKTAALPIELRRQEARSHVAPAKLYGTLANGRNRDGRP